MLLSGNGGGAADSEEAGACELCWADWAVATAAPWTIAIAMIDKNNNFSFTDIPRTWKSFC
jgi:hypothetical protein